jgi:ATP-binding cassette subfamily A (ABC1) protein 3
LTVLHADYQKRGFLFLQQAITFALINNDEVKEPAVPIQMNRYPFPRWPFDPFYFDEIAPYLSLVMMISFMYNYINTIRAIATEKEKQLKVVELIQSWSTVD